MTHTGTAAEYLIVTYVIAVIVGLADSSFKMYKYCVEVEYIVYCRVTMNNVLSKIR